MNTPKFNAILIKIPRGFSMKLDKMIYKFLWASKRLRIAKAIWKNKVREIVHLCNIAQGLLPNISQGICLKVYYKAVATKIMCYCCRERKSDQWERLKKSRKIPTHSIQKQFYIIEA